MKRKPEKRKIRGIEFDQEIGKDHLFRDVRPIWSKMLDPFRTAQGQATLILASACTGFFIPGILIPCFLIALLVTLIRAMTFRNERLPWRLPMTSNIKRDPGNRKPGSKRHGPAEGVYFIGNDHKTNEELWLSLEDILAHIMALGTTGSGKTEFFVALAFNALATGSGLIYIDAKVTI